MESGSVKRYWIHLATNPWIQPDLDSHPSQFQDHVDSKHRDAQYPCSTCGKVFGSKSLLRGHEHTHTDVRKFGCQECDKRFRTREKLKNHQSVHTRNNRFIKTESLVYFNFFGGGGGQIEPWRRKNS